jgi:glutamate-1-semialdehyde 2,1-aminomutase
MRFGQRVLVAGGAGFLGSHLCDRLIWDGAHVLCVDNFSTGSASNVAHLRQNPMFELITHDITVPLRAQVNEIYNLASPASPLHYQRDPVQTAKTNVVGALNLLDLARRANAKVLQASTSEIYGDPDMHPQAEDYWGHVNPIGPRACYDEGKRCAETLFFDYQRQHKLRIRIARIFNTYGPRMQPDDGRVVSGFIMQALTDEDITIFGNGSQTRSFCYVDDLIEGMVRLMDSPDDGLGPVNLGNPHEISMIALAECIIELTGSASRLVYRPLPQDDPQRRCPNIGKAKTMLEWEPKVTLREGLALTIETFRRILRNPAGDAYSHNPVPRVSHEPTAPITQADHVSDKVLRKRAARVLAPCVNGSVYGRVSNPLTPPGTPQFFARAKGARLWDTDGREYIDFLCAYGPNLLGYGDPRVEAAAERQRLLGNTMTGPAPVVVELAEKLVETVSHADWALFAKNGTDATNAALLIARAQTGKRRVLVATDSYHGAAPWCTPVLAGVLPEERAHRKDYAYNDVTSLEEAVADAGDDLAAIFATGFKHDRGAAQEMPRVDYARRCRELCDRTGALLVVDDIRAGFRLARDCSWALVGVQPDLSCWSKAIANGYPLSAVLGSDHTRKGASKVLVAGTYWLEAVPMAAAVATLKVIKETNYLEHTVELGHLLRIGLDKCAAAHGFTLSQTGPVQMPQILFKNDPDVRYGRAFAGAMIQRGIYIHPLHNLFLCAALTKDDIARTLRAANDAFGDLTKRRSKIEPHPLMAHRTVRP